MGLEIISQPGAEVAEGPYWDDQTGELYWVDLLRGDFYRHHLGSGRETKLTLPQALGAAVPRRDGGFVGAVRDGIATFTGPDDFEVIAPIALEKANIRMNDAKCDRRGRLWAGTMEGSAAPGQGTLYRVAADFSVTVAVPNVTQSNGLGWSPDGRLMYFIDTQQSRVDVWDFDMDAGEMRNRRVFCYTPQGILPDGLTVDADGGVWVAHFGGGRVQRYAPDGTTDVAVELPVSEVTSCTFGDPDLDTLFITTAAYPWGEWGREPLAGSIFAATPGPAGLTNHRFGDTPPGGRT